MNVEGMREWLKARYPDSKKWERRVKYMPTSQVIAIYYRLKKKES